MCRLLAYCGRSVALERLLFEPEHSLYVQSYAPKEMSSGVVNADGFGIVWYDRARSETPFLYKSVLPIWADANLASLARYVAAGHVLANVRSATPGQATEWSNTHPFVMGRWSGMHNGFVQDFHNTLYRPLRERLSDATFGVVRGNTDSEHVFAYVVDRLHEGRDVAEALALGLKEVLKMAPRVVMTLTFVVSDGETVAAARIAQHAEPPSLYWTYGAPGFPESVMVASEPLSPDGGWQQLADNMVLRVGADLSMSAIEVA